LLDVWNESHPNEAANVGDTIREVNGVSGDAARMAEICRNSPALTMRVLQRRQEQVPPPTSPAPSLTQSALQPGSTVDFPQITEICERLVAEPGEAEATVHVLVSVLRDASPLQQKLKALTIANELMYSPEAVAAFRAAYGCREALAVLRTTRTSPQPTQADSGQADTTVEENIRMFAAEVERIVFVDGGTLATRTRRFFPPMRKSGFGSSSPFGDLKGKAEKTLEKRLKTPDMQFAVQRAFSGMVEKTAATTTSAMRKVMQEAQGLLDTGEKASPPASPRRLSRQSPMNRGGFSSPKGNEMMCPSGEQEEDWQLQWALSASLAESQKLPESSASDAENFVESSSPRSQVETGRGSDVGSLRGPAGDGSQSQPQGSETEAAALRKQLLESQAHANALAEQLARAQKELEWANARLREAERSLETQKQSHDTERPERDQVYETVVQQLLDRIAVLEAMCGETGPY
jgi:hypothetical protein